MTIEKLTFAAFQQGREQGREESAAQIERLREALKPFSDCVVHLHPAHDPEAETLDGIKVREWRAAYEALQPEEGEA